VTGSGGVAVRSRQRTSLPLWTWAVRTTSSVWPGRSLRAARPSAPSRSRLLVPPIVRRDAASVCCALDLGAAEAGRGGDLLRRQAGVHELARPGEQLGPPLYDHDTWG
jgi:hypothetical protein